MMAIGIGFDDGYDGMVFVKTDADKIKELQSKIEQQEKRIAELRQIVADFQDRYHGCLDENKKLRGLLVEAYPTIERCGNTDLITKIQELLKDDTQMPS